MTDTLREQIAQKASHAFASVNGGPGWDLAVADAILPLIASAEQKAAEEMREAAEKVAAQEHSACAGAIKSGVGSRRRLEDCAYTARKIGFKIRDLPLPSPPTLTKE